MLPWKGKIEDEICLWGGISFNLSLERYKCISVTMGGAFEQLF